QNVRNILAALLVPGRSRGSHLTCSRAAESFRDVDDNVLQTATGTYDYVFSVHRVAGVLLSAARLFRHIDGLLMRRRAIEFDGSGDFAFPGGANIPRRIKRY